MRGRTITSWWLEALIIAALTSGCAALSAWSQCSSCIWPVNGVLVVLLLQQGRRELAGRFAVFGIVIFLALLAVGLHPYDAWARTVANLSEVLIVFLAIDPHFDVREGRLDKTAVDVVLITIAACAVSAGTYFWLQTAAGHHETLWRTAGWFFGNGLGMLLVVPGYILVRRHALSGMFAPGQRRGTVLYLLLAACVAAAVFGQTWTPLAVLLFPVLTLITFARGTAGGVSAIGVMAAVAIPLNRLGMGPFVMLSSTTLDERQVALEILLLLCLGTVYPVGRTLQARRRVEELYGLVASHSRDVITRVDLSGIRTFASPSVQEVLGWAPEDVIGVPAADLMHPDDRDRYAGVLKAMRSGKEQPTFVYRGRRPDGEYVWLEATMRLVQSRRDGRLLEYIATSRDVTERMVAEKELMAAYSELERLATLDGLTQVSNRRSFDEMLDREWRRAMRDGSQISLLMLDVDFFKKYNDALGHPAGDECLRRVAMAITNTVQRSSDLVARYGGEEFAVLLPTTGMDGAMSLARRITISVSALEVEHPGSPIGYVTCSIGVAAISPATGGQPTELLEAADSALYLAKRSGRNRIHANGPQIVSTASQAV